MADKSAQLVVEALHRAVAEPSGVPLFGQKTGAGLFGGTASGRQGARLCQEQDLLRVVRTEARGKSARAIVGITRKGLEHLLRESDARQVLEDLVRAVEGRERQLAEVIETARQVQANLESVKGLAAEVTRRFDHEAAKPGGGRSNPAPELATALARYLESWQASNCSKDCPLPHLYQQLPGMTVGQFHDALRELHNSGRIYLHPWTGPLPELPEPQLALMVGHEIAFYASWRVE